MAMPSSPSFFTSSGVCSAWRRRGLEWVWLMVLFPLLVTPLRRSCLTLRDITFSAERRQHALQLVRIALDIKRADAILLGGRGRQCHCLHELAGRVVEHQAARQAVDARRLEAPGAAARQPREADERLGHERAAVQR